MNRLRRSIIPIFVVSLAFLALIIAQVGFYKRFWEDDQLGGIYIFIGGLIAIAGTVVIFLYNRKKR